MGDIIDARKRAREFAEVHLPECAAEILEWHDTAILRDGKVRELAALSCNFIAKHDALRVAESFVNRAALEFVAAHKADKKEGE